jgi:hypothetical protein
MGAVEGKPKFALFRHRRNPQINRQDRFDDENPMFFRLLGRKPTGCAEKVTVD